MTTPNPPPPSGEESIAIDWRARSRAQEAEIAELRDERLRGLRIAYTITLDTQSIPEAMDALVEQVRKARAERDAGDAKLARLRQLAREVLTAVRSVLDGRPTPLHALLKEMEREAGG